MRRLADMARRITRTAALAGGILAVVFCGVGPIGRHVESGADVCREESWGDPEPAGLATHGPAGAAPRRPRPLAEADVLPGREIEDPNGHALDAFYQTLARVDRDGEPGDLARVSCYGDSHTAADFMTGRLRRRMQRRFGDGGHGFVVAGRPWPSYRHRDARNGGRGRWETRLARHNARAGEMDGLLGLAGIAVETDQPEAMGWVGTADGGDLGGAASRLELYFLGQPRGGDVRLVLDGVERARLSTRRDGFVPAFHLLEADDGPHELRVESLGHGMVRLYGVVLEREGPGVVVDSFGVNGARVTAMLAWDRDLFAASLAHRAPDLVVLWYGANSVGDDWYDIDEYEQWVIDALTRVRRAVPEASCLFVGPPDMARASFADHGPPGTPPQLARIIEAQRDAAGLVGCGYFDIFAAMGGHGSNRVWADETPPLVSGDGIHFTAPGYERLGDLLYEALEDGFERYLEAHPAE